MAEKKAKRKAEKGGKSDSVDEDSAALAEGVESQQIDNEDV